VSSLKPFLRDGVDVYVRGNEEVHFVFLATRRRLVTKARPYLILSLSWLNGQETIDSLATRMASEHGDEAKHHFLSFVEYLTDRGIVVDRDWLPNSGLSSLDIETLERQLTFLLDVLGTPERVTEVQSRISSASIVCFGVGAVGGWLLRLLVGMGFRHFLLVDHDTVSISDSARHAFADATKCRVGEYKAVVLAECLARLAPGVNVEALARPLSTATDLQDLVSGNSVDLMINAADEPYIGYTSILLSRFCVPRCIPLLVAGGFDAHLASVSEMIIPGQTPCGDCYADYFQEALADWKPIAHPVTDRRNGAGGLCALNVFAAANAAMKAFNLFANPGNISGGRGELLFEDYRLESFPVTRRNSCPVCAER
jgi:molybdopterin/thiamine biosynthesis adenylyltransferase